MYTIHTTIQNRRQWICELKAESQNGESAEFVTEFDKTNLFNLFSISPLEHLTTFIEETCDIPFQNWQVAFSEQNDTIHIDLDDKSIQQNENKSPAPKQTKSFFDSIGDTENPEERTLNEHKFQLKREFSLNSKQITFTCSHNDKGIYIDAKVNKLNEILFDLNLFYIQITYKSYSCKIKLNICHPKQFLGVALDFGSEASQLAVSTYQNNLLNPQMPINEDLFDTVKHLMQSKNIGISDTQVEYYQEEKGTKFFKSVFFVKSNLGSVDSAFNSENFLRNSDENLKILVDKSSGKLLTQPENKHFQLPNVKIIHGHHDLLDDIKFKITRNNYSASISLNNILDKVHNSVLMYLLESYILKDYAINELARYVRLTLLVPNIYDSDSVLSIQKRIREILSNFQLKNVGNILGFEVVTISESDAAMVGYMSKPDNTIKPNKQYIIIDAGKGTTDFSVVKTGQEDIFKIIPIYRNGFAGAGNLITNALFETFIHFIRSQNNANPNILSIIKNKLLDPLQQDVAVRNDFFDELERLKKGFTTNLSVINQWEQASSSSIKLKDIGQSGVDINTIVNILSQIDAVADFYQYVELALETISEKVVASLEILKKSMPEIDYEGVILTGRGFLFKPLQQKLMDKINARLSIDSNNIFILKNNELKDVCIKGVFNRSMQLNSEVIGYPIQKIKSNTNTHTTPKKENAKPKPSIYDRVRNLLGSIEGEEITYVFSQSHALKANQLRNSTFQIGAKSYSIPNDEHFYSSLQSNSEIKIEFTHEGYILRHLIHGKLIRICTLQHTFELANADKAIIIPSLFPNYINADFLESMNIQIQEPPQKTIIETPTIPPPKTTFDELKF